MVRWQVGTDDMRLRHDDDDDMNLCSSLSLHVGKEIYDVSKANIQNDHTHLFVRHQKSMQAQAVFRTKLSFRYEVLSFVFLTNSPCLISRQHSNDSLAHLKLKFASKANPAPKVRVLSNIKAAIMDTDEMRRVRLFRRESGIGHRSSISTEGRATNESGRTPTKSTTTTARTGCEQRSEHVGKLSRGS